MSAGSTGKNSSGEAASFSQWLKVMSTFQEASDEIRGQLAALGKCPLLGNNDNAFYGVRLCTNPFWCQHLGPESTEGTDGAGVGRSHTACSPQ